MGTKRLINEYCLPTSRLSYNNEFRGQHWHNDERFRIGRFGIVYGTNTVTHMVLGKSFSRALIETA